MFAKLIFLNHLKHILLNKLKYKNKCHMDSNFSLKRLNIHKLN